MPELEHLSSKIPNIPQNLFQQLKTAGTGRFNRSLQEKQDFALSDYLNNKNSIMGLQIPCPFKIYGNFEIKCHENYEILLGT